MSVCLSVCLSARISQELHTRISGMSSAINCAWDRKKVKFSHTRYQALGPELIPVYRQSARKWREVNHAIDPAVGCRYFLPGLRLPPWLSPDGGTCKRQHTSDSSFWFVLDRKVWTLLKLGMITAISFVFCEVRINQSIKWPKWCYHCKGH